jgi:hypothetical protein
LTQGQIIVFVSFQRKMKISPNKEKAKKGRGFTHSQGKFGDSCGVVKCSNITSPCSSVM